MTQKVLVTGGAGYIGSVICKFLSKNGISPITLDNLSRGHEDAVKFGPFFKGNISDLEILKKIRNEHEISGVIHCAAYAYVGESVENPDLYFENNFEESRKFLNNLIATGGIPSFVFSSTCATYGNPNYLPIDENHPQNPINPYGETKLNVEKLIKELSDTHGFNYSILRYFNAAGADPELEVGERHNPETHLIPLALNASASDNFQLQVYGSDFDTDDGSAIRDYIHVWDLASAHYNCLIRNIRDKKNMTLNLGTSKGSSVFEVIEAINRVTKNKVKYKLSSRREGDPAALYADNSLAQNEINWGADLRSLEDCIRDAYKFLESNRQ